MIDWQTILLVGVTIGLTVGLSLLVMLPHIQSVADAIRRGVNRVTRRMFGEMNK